MAAFNFPTNSGTKTQWVSYILIIIFLFTISCNDEDIDDPKDKPTAYTYTSFPASPEVKEGYTLEFQDEFNDKTLNASKWPSPAGVTSKYNFNDSCINIFIDENTQPSNGDKVYNFRVSQIYSFKNSKKLSNGSFVTTVTETEGYATQYGYFEMRAMIPDCGGGGHCAWWMVGAPNSLSDTTKNAEIDIFEVLFSNVNNSHPKVRAWYDTSCFDWKKSVTNAYYPSKEFHIYGMDWSPSGLKFYYDNKLIAATANSPAYKMSMFISIYTAANKLYWSGWDNGVYPKTLSVDYVRVWKKNS